MEMVECELSPARVAVHDDGSQASMHDFDLLQPDGEPIGAVEVTAAADAESIELWNLVNGTGECWRESGIEQAWSVTLLPQARVKRLRKELPALLIECQRRKIRELETGWTRYPDPLTAQAQDLGVVHAFHGPTDWPGTIYLTIEQEHERIGGSPSAGALCTWIPEFLHSPEQRHNLEKLAASDRSERHLFVLLPGFTTAPFGATSLLWYDDVPLPSDPPRLPEQVTHVWFASTMNWGTGIRWGPACGWRRFDRCAGDASRQ